MGCVGKQYFLRGKVITGRPLELGIHPSGTHVKSSILYGLVSSPVQSC